MLMMSRKHALLFLFSLIVLAVLFAIYRKWSASQLDVTPDAQREIERAKRR
jgi:hypothetical protein